MVSIKIHRSYRNVVAICDSDLLGKKFEDGKFQLDIRENFYKDREFTKEEALELIKRQALEDSTFNIVGKESINLALESGIISQKSIGRISGIPFALILV